MRFNASKTLLRIEIRLIRIFNTYGPRMDPNDGRVLSNFTVQTLQGTDITIYGEGSQTRSFCFVDDLVRGIVAFCEQSKSIGPMNLGNDKEFTVKDLADRVLNKIGGKSKIVFKPLVKRFDRRSSGERRLLEDFAQIFKYMESDKEEGSMEEIASAIDKYSSSPVI